MNDMHGQSQDPLAARVTELEALFTHLQRTVAELDQVVLTQQRQLQVLEGKTARLSVDLSAVAGSVSEERNPEEEKPPHY